MKELPICSCCQDDEVSLSNTSAYGWICEQCLVDIEDYEKNCEQYEADKRKRIFEAQEY